MTPFLLSLAVAAGATSTPALAAGPTFTPEAQFRPRFEADSGRDFDEDTGNVAYITHRARFGGTLGLGPVDVRMVFQDVRAWGEETDTRRDYFAEGIDLGVGTVAWRPHDDLTILVGRQEVSLLDERLVARANWRQPGRRFDGAKITWTDGTWAAEAGGFLTIEGDRFFFETQDQVEPATAGDQTLWFGRAGRQTDTLIAQAVVVLDDRRQTTGAEVLRSTQGVFVKRGSGSLSGHAEAYVQLGTVAGGTQQVRAGMVGVSGQLAPDTAAKPVVGLKYDLLSGDGDPTDGVVTAFDTVRGANHRYYGHQDIAVFFRGGPAGAQGLHDPQLVLGVQPMEGWSLSLVQHVFAPAAVAPGAESWVALEPDLSTTVALAPSFSLIGGASVWADVGELDAPMERFAYLMLDVAMVGQRLGHQRQELAIP